MSDARRDLWTHGRKCGRCERPFDLGEDAYEPGEHDDWTWPRLPICSGCVDALETAERAKASRARLARMYAHLLAPTDDVWHTAECARWSDEMQAIHDRWVARWPGHCKRCRGRGVYGSHEDDWPCEDCSEAGVCARCGEPGLTSEERGDDSTGEGPCKSCGWDYDDARPEDGPFCCCPREEA